VGWRTGPQRGGQRRTTGGLYNGAPTSTTADDGFPVVGGGPSVVGVAAGGGTPAVGCHQPPIVFNNLLDF
jgi:hypothetical protein